MEVGGSFLEVGSFCLKKAETENSPPLNSEGGTELILNGKSRVPQRFDEAAKTSYNLVIFRT